MSREDVGLCLFKMFDVLNCVLEERCWWIFLVNFWENFVFDFSLLFCLLDLLKSVGEGMGFSLEKLGMIGLLSVGEILSGGGWVCCLVFGLLGFEYDFWWEI